jgi:hypothetical protein
MFWFKLNDKLGNTFVSMDKIGAMKLVEDCPKKALAVEGGINHP